MSRNAHQCLGFFSLSLSLSRFCKHARRQLTHQRASKQRVCATDSAANQQVLPRARRARTMHRLTYTRALSISPSREMQLKAKQKATKNDDLVSLTRSHRHAAETTPLRWAGHRESRTEWEESACGEGGADGRTRRWGGRECTPSEQVNAGCLRCCFFRSAARSVAAARGWAGCVF